MRLLSLMRWSAAANAYDVGLKLGECRISESNLRLVTLSEMREGRGLHDQGSHPETTLLNSAQSAASGDRRRRQPPPLRRTNTATTVGRARPKEPRHDASSRPRPAPLSRPNSSPRRRRLHLDADQQAARRAVKANAATNLELAPSPSDQERPQSSRHRLDSLPPETTSPGSCRDWPATQALPMCSAGRRIMRR